MRDLVEHGSDGDRRGDRLDARSDSALLQRAALSRQRDAIADGRAQSPEDVHRGSDLVGAEHGKCGHDVALLAIDVQQHGPTVHAVSEPADGDAEGDLRDARNSVERDIIGPAIQERLVLVAAHAEAQRNV